MKTGLIGWRGMVGSVLMDRMRAENDFEQLSKTVCECIPTSTLYLCLELCFIFLAFCGFSFVRKVLYSRSGFSFGCASGLFPDELELSPGLLVPTTSGLGFRLSAPPLVFASWEVQRV